MWMRRGALAWQVVVVLGLTTITLFPTHLSSTLFWFYFLGLPWMLGMGVSASYLLWLERRHGHSFLWGGATVVIMMCWAAFGGYFVHFGPLSTWVEYLLVLVSLASATVLAWRFLRWGEPH